MNQSLARPGNVPEWERGSFRLIVLNISLKSFSLTKGCVRFILQITTNLGQKSVKGAESCKDELAFCNRANLHQGERGKGGLPCCTALYVRERS